ncbi:zinc-ribbon domain-containing protein, partial [Candidatus Bathyarchaeota archaeon]|nr:zinc-ribbon domain-containing protein [Candidatus Bathyarchaeota archaeon]
MKVLERLCLVYCTKCGLKNEDDATVCAKCGAS